MRRLWPWVALLALAACATPPHTPPAPLPPPTAEKAAPQNAREAGVASGAALSARPAWASFDARAARIAFQRSCPALLKRSDNSGLTENADWTEACAAAATASDDRAFFENYFTPVRIGDGTGLNTGYFEPEIAGARTPQAGYTVPIYKRPTDLIEVDLGLFSDQWKDKKIRGQLQGQKLLPYPDRAAIEQGALAGRGLELAWAADIYEFFFLQVQGSGRLRLPDGTIMRIGYDSQNGRDYTGIGKLLLQRNALAPGQATMDGIIAWMKANPDAARDVMRENKSYVFFRELTGEGPLGALGILVEGGVSVAADPRFVPLGAPLWLETQIFENGTQNPSAQLWIAQDTGGAIKGANRFDLFWGAGARARAVAGALSARGQAMILLPKPAAQRLLTDNASAAR